MQQVVQPPLDGKNSPDDPMDNPQPSLVHVTVCGMQFTGQMLVETVAYREAHRLFTVFKIWSVEVRKNK